MTIYRLATLTIHPSLHPGRVTRFFLAARHDKGYLSAIASALVGGYRVAQTLIKLGVPVKLAIDIGLSRKGCHRLSRTMATQLGMTNQWLKAQGLLSIKELWIAFHYKR